MDKALNYLGLSKKAGLLAIGSEAVAIAARKNKAVLIITASDASDGSVRRAKFNAESGGARYFAAPYTRFDFGKIVGRGSPGTIAFLDKGLADGFTEKLKEKPISTKSTRKESNA